MINDRFEEGRGFGRICATVAVFFSLFASPEAVSARGDDGGKVILTSNFELQDPEGEWHPARTVDFRRK